MNYTPQNVLIVDLSHLFWTTALGMRAALGARDAVMKDIRGLARQYDRVAIACDASGPSFREAIFPKYKANRKAERTPERWAALASLREHCDAAGFHVFVGPEHPEHPEHYYESDDVIATLVAWCVRFGIPADILSGDSDLAQLVDDEAQICFLRNYRGAYTRMSAISVEEWKGVPPAKILEVKALAGDGDGYKPFPGIADDGALAALRAAPEFTARSVIATVLDKGVKKNKDGKTENRASRILFDGGHKAVDFGYEMARLRSDAPVAADSLIVPREVSAMPEIGDDFLPPESGSTSAEGTAAPDGSPMSTRIMTRASRGWNRAWHLLAKERGDAAVSNNGETWQYIDSEWMDGAMWHFFRHRSLPPQNERVTHRVRALSDDFEAIDDDAAERVSIEAGARGDAPAPMPPTGVQSQAITLQRLDDHMLMSPTEMRSRYVELRAFIKSCMVQGTDYGTIPGCGPKPVLLQPGAEKLADLYGYACSFETVQKIERWDDDVPFFFYHYKCKVKRKSDDTQVAEYEGSANSRESKWAARWVFEREVPQHLDIDRLRFREYPTKNDPAKKFRKFMVPNENIFEQVNTIQKIAQKRAMVSAVRLATRTAGIFEVDEDVPREAFGEARPRPQWDE